MRITVAGAGPAGALAALVAQNAGAQVDWISTGRGSAQAVHVHILRDGIFDALCALDAGLRGPLAACKDPNHRWMQPDGRIRTADRLGRAGLAEALEVRLRGLGLCPRNARAEDQRPQDADLWIDASGGNRALMRLGESLQLGALTLDDLEESRPWETRLWQRTLPGAPFTLVAPGRFYLQAEVNDTRLTGPSQDDSDQLAKDSLQDLIAPRLSRILSHLTGPADQKWRAIGPPTRLARWIGDGNRPGVLPFGDALVQTPPMMGHGIMAAVEQAAILQAHFHDPDRCLAELTDWAEALWISSGLQMQVFSP